MREAGTDDPAPSPGTMSDSRCAPTASPRPRSLVSPKATRTRYAPTGTLHLGSPLSGAAMPGAPRSAWRPTYNDPGPGEGAPSEQHLSLGSVIPGRTKVVNQPRPSVRIQTRPKGYPLCRGWLSSPPCLPPNHSEVLVLYCRPPLPGRRRVPTVATTPYLNETTLHLRRWRYP